MKKTIIIFAVIMLVFTGFIFAEKGDTTTAAAAVTDTASTVSVAQEAKPYEPETHRLVTGYGWALIGADAILAGLTVWAVMDYNTQADAYNTLREQIDNTTVENYWRLMYEKEKVDDRVSNVVIPLSVGSACLLYTIIDYFWLHNAFPVEVKAGYNQSANSTMIQITKEF